MEETDTIKLQECGLFHRDSEPCPSISDLTPIVLAPTYAQGRRWVEIHRPGVHPLDRSKVILLTPKTGARAVLGTKWTPHQLVIITEGLDSIPAWERDKFEDIRFHLRSRAGQQ